MWGGGNDLRPYTFESVTGGISKTLELKQGDVVGVITSNASSTNMKVNNVAIPSTGSNEDVTTIGKGQYSSSVIILHDGDFTISCTAGSTTSNKIFYPIQ